MSERAQRIRALKTNSLGLGIGLRESTRRVARLSDLLVLVVGVRAVMHVGEKLDAPLHVVHHARAVERGP